MSCRLFGPFGTHCRHITYIFIEETTTQTNARRSRGVLFLEKASATATAQHRILEPNFISEPSTKQFVRHNKTYAETIFP